MLPPTIPIFPLPNVVLFPNVFLPLHIFEPRYRAMVTDALAGDRIIGMTLLRPGYEAEYDGRPPVYSVGCAGVITHCDPLPDGRFNLVLRGLGKFRITGEEEGQPYRVARVEGIAEELDETAAETLQRQRLRLEAVIAAMIERNGGEPRFPPAITDADLVNALSQYLQLAPIERQALLEQDGVVARCGALIDLIEMRALAPTAAWDGTIPH